MGSEIPELKLLFVGFLSSMRAMLFGGIMIFFLLMFFSVIIVNFLHPVNAEINYASCDRCSRGFASVMGTTLTLFQQIVAGDAWGQISIPVIEQSRLGLMLPFVQVA